MKQNIIRRPASKKSYSSGICERVDCVPLPVRQNIWWRNAADPSPSPLPRMDRSWVVYTNRFVRFYNLSATFRFLPLQSIAQQSFGVRPGAGKPPEILFSARSLPLLDVQGHRFKFFPSSRRVGVAVLVE